MRNRQRCGLLVTTGVAVLMIPSARASDCDVTSVGFVPVNDLGAGRYLDAFAGGLYPGGLNVPPAPHHLEGRARAAGIEPLDTDGQPSDDGTYVLLSIGMSNTTQEFCNAGGDGPCNSWSFMGQAADDERVNHTTLTIANGARGGQAAGAWESPDHANYDRIRDTVLASRGLTEAQVQVVWVKVANPGPSVPLPHPDADAYNLVRSTGNIARTLRVRYPNVKLVFLSSRIYAGYASTGLNPEPYAYESGFSAKWLIEAQIDQMAGGKIDPNAGDLDYDTVAPWIGWGAYLWADGLEPRSDGLIWRCPDFSNDGTHPSTSGEEKVGTRLLRSFLNSPYTRLWFRVGNPCGPLDLDGSGDVGFGDVLAILGAWGPCEGECPEDLDHDDVVGFGDVLLVLGGWGDCE